MQLTSNDERDLLIPLYAGVHDQAQWRIFLARLRKRITADYASLIFAQGDRPVHLSKEIFAGRDLRGEAEQLGLQTFMENDRLPYRELRPGRVYDIDDLVLQDSRLLEFHNRYNGALGIRAGRIVRIKEQEGTSAWLTLAHGERIFSAADSALLAAIAPHFTVALRSFVLTERQRVRAAAGREGLARAGVGWIALARDTRIIDVDPGLMPLLERINESSRIIGQRLHVEPSSAREELSRSASLFADDPDISPRIMILMEEPRVEALLVPVSEHPEAATDLPVMLIFCRTVRPSKFDRRRLLGELFGLSLREAEMALAISAGQSIGEAGAAMGLTETTARSYSKQIYVKMGVSGQADLVRRIFTSVAGLI